MNTALSDKMTLTRLPLVLSGCFIILFMCGHSTVLCALNEEAGNQPNMTRRMERTISVASTPFIKEEEKLALEKGTSCCQRCRAVRQILEEHLVGLVSWHASLKRSDTFRSGGNAPSLAPSDMKGALGFIGVFLSFLSATAATDESTVTCGSGHFCESLCALCESYFGGPTMDCLSALFGHSCLPKFNTPMDLMNTTDWCVWGNVNSLYSNLSFCTEEMSDCLQIPWPNPLVEQLFVEIHSTYFKECPTEEFSDPAPATVFALVITPICLIPVMVSLVVLKTKNGDGSS